MKVPQLLPLDTSKRAVCIFLLCQSVRDDMNRELSTTGHKHSKALNRFASRPKAEFAEAISRQIFPGDFGREPHIPHGTKDLVR
jgi:hypothetical protein